MTHGGNPDSGPTAALRILPAHYRLERELGRGGMAIVYLCTDLRDGRLVAVKLLRPRYASAVPVERFLREVELVSKLDHPCIPKVIETGVTAEVPFYVMTFVPGEPLRKILDRETRLPIAEAVRIARAVIDPMGYAHDCGIVHRDIKPDNIVVDGDAVHVLDFGIARAIADAGGERLTRTGLTVGTPAYVSPEQAMNDRTLDHRSDIFSLGCVLYEMLAGAPAFTGSTTQALIARRFDAPPRPLRELREGVPEWLEFAVAKAMMVSPNDRWASAAEFGAALDESTSPPVMQPAPGVAEELEREPYNELLLRLRANFAESFRVDDEMKGGGMSRLFLATDLVLHRKVVIKILPPELTSPMMLARFRRESEVTARLQHPHILPVISAGVSDGLAYYIMPFFEGESLRARLDREGRLPLADGIRILSEMTDALSCAHENGVTHRDIKPENILILGGHAVLADFGIASALSGSGNEHGERITGTGISLGTVGYMAPEQALGEKNVDGRADIYSIGVIGYEIFSGTPPFGGASDRAILVGHLTRDPEPLERLRDDMPEGVGAAIRKALQKDPASRFQSAAEFHDALEASRQTPAAPATGAVETGGTSTNPTPNAGGAAPATIRRADARWWKVGVAVATLALVAAVAVYFGSREDASTRPTLDPRKVAVLYFRDLSPRRDLGHLADALTEELIANLQEVDALDVVSKNGVQQIRLADLERDSAARVLKAGTLVEGSVEPVGDRLRMVVAVSDGSSGDELQRASFEYPAADPMALRERVVRDVSEFLRQRLGEEVRLSEWKSDTDDPQAWVLAQRGEKYTKEAESLAAAGDTAGATRRLQLADSILSLSSARDGKWVEPVVMRGTVAFRRSRIASLGPEKARWVNAGMVFADKALALDPGNAAGRELRGTLRYWSWLNDLATDPAEAANLLRLAEADLRAAVKTAPGRASAWSVLSSLFSNKPDPVEAAMAAQRAYEEDAYLSAAPDIVWRLYSAAYDNEQSVAAERWCSEGQRRFPTNPRFVQCRLWLLTLPGRKVNIDSAWQLVDDLHKLTPERDWKFAGREAPMLVAAGLARAGLQDSARRVLERSRGDATVDPTRDLLVDEAVVRVIIGDKDEALRLLRTYLVANPEHREGMAKTQSWWWRDLKADPRYQEMLGK
ncbi:MAG: serine/threonine-protein kinase [Gemmatimonadaceae bacterium]